MKAARVILGSSFGDEGKGLCVDHYSHENISAGRDVLVVRQNSGAQAGHSVQLPSGHRHVFHHFGSGSLAGASTYLSRFFICNPILFWKEQAELTLLTQIPPVYVHPDCLISTPWDMIINQSLEDARGITRHGSCGVGINETVDRSAHPEFCILFSDILRGDFEHKLNRIYRDWVPKRFAHHGVIPTDLLAELSQSYEVFSQYVDDAKRFAYYVEPHDELPLDADIILEGAQGLLLDQRHEWFPHVTRSSTGLTNVLELMPELQIDHLDITYVTRFYATRHGAGPMPWETIGGEYNRLPDLTNQPHDYQGVLRHGLLDLDLLAKTIQADLAKAPDGVIRSTQLLITHMDQMGLLKGDPSWVEDGKVITGSGQLLVTQAVVRTDLDEIQLSFGPTRDTIVDCTDFDRSDMDELIEDNCTGR